VKEMEEQPRHPYRFPPLQEKLTGAVVILAPIIFIMNVFLKITSTAVMLPTIVVFCGLYIASLIAGFLKK